MELRFKSVALQKSWILLDDKIIYGGKRNTVKRGTNCKVIANLQLLKME